MASTEISPRALVNAIQSLNDEQSKELFFQLEVPLHILDEITADYRGSMRKIHYVQAWFDHEVGASLEKIVTGLKQIGQNALAERLNLQCYHKATLTSTSSSDHPFSPATEEKDPPTDESSPGDLTLGLLPHPSSSPPPSDKVLQVRTEIDQLDDTFSDRMFDAEMELAKRGSKDPAFFMKFRHRLLSLPVSQKATHTKFFRENEDDILKAKQMCKIFAILRRYCNYRNYELLHEVVRKFCNTFLQLQMKEYCKTLERFEKETAVDVYLKAISAGDILCSEFTKMTMKINKSTSACTLYDIRKLKEAITERASLTSYSMYIGEVVESSVKLELGFPASCVGWVLGAMTPEFLAMHLLSDVFLGQEQLSILQEPHTELNRKLIHASVAGDVMRTMSLLNSGADVQTVDKWSDTSLYYASMRGHLQVVRLLKSRRAEVECKDKLGWTPLMTAAANGHLSVVRELIFLEADVNVQDKKYGYSALILSASGGHTSIVVELMNAGANLDLQNKRGDSAIVKATVNCRPDTLRELVRAGSDLHRHNQEGLTALMIAARVGTTDITEILLEGEHIHLDIQENRTGWSALHFSAEGGNRATTQALIKAGANVHLTDKNGLTALDIAEVNAAEEKDKHKSFPSWYYKHDYEGVIHLLREHKSHAPPRHCDSSASAEQDNAPTKEAALAFDTPPTELNLTSADENSMHSQRKPRLISQALRNLVNRSGQIAVQIFNELDRRLKSADRKELARIRGGDIGQAVTEDKEKIPLQ